jgi:glutathione peroxidase-family protein
MERSLKPDQIWDITVRDIDFNEGSLRSFMEGMKCALIVNVASNWPFAKKNYQQLVKLDRRYRKHGLKIIGFPCNQFQSQEPRSNEDIKKYTK